MNEDDDQDWSRRAAIAGLGASALLLPACIGTSAPNRAEEPVDLSAIETAVSGRLGACAIDGASGRTLSWRADERFAYCSTFKTFLAAAMLERVAAGEERLERRIAVRETDLVAHAPVTGPAAGGSLSVQELAKAMVELSDNPAANILIRELGGLEAWSGWYRDFGDPVTRVDRLETELNSAIPGDPRDTTTPRQFAANLRRLFTSDRLAPADRDLLRRWMLDSPTGPNRIKAAAPAGSLVAHKTGSGAHGQTNDIGMVWRPGQAPIFIALFLADAAAASAEARDRALAEAARTLIAAI